MMAASKPTNWRDVLPVHPAAELFPLMTTEQLRELAADIEKHGLREKASTWQNPETGKIEVLDGRNRLDALELLGGNAMNWDKSDFRLVGVIAAKRGSGYLYETDPAFDPYAFVLSKNIHRRHLTPEQKDELIEKLLKAKPEQSNRVLAKQAKSSHKKVAKARKKLEATGALPQLEKTTGADGKARKQPAKRKPAEVEITFIPPCDRRKRVFAVRETLDSPQEAYPAPTSSADDLGIPACLKREVETEPQESAEPAGTPKSAPLVDLTLVRAALERVERENLGGNPETLQEALRNLSNKAVDAIYRLKEKPDGTPIH
jgi:ParB-like chromosome segregation protein Spo0J